MKTVNAKLRMTLDIQVGTPATGGKEPYSKRSSADQHKSKMKFLQPLSVTPWKTVGKTKGILDDWLSLPNVEVDDYYVDTVPDPVETFLARLFDAANRRLAHSKLGYQIALGNQRPSLNCAPCSDQSRAQRYAFEVQVVTGPIQTQWVAHDDGVQAPVVVVLEWNVPAGAARAIPVPPTCVPTPVQQPIEVADPMGMPAVANGATKSGRKGRAKKLGAK